MLFAVISKDMYRGKTRNNAKQACSEGQGQTGGAKQAAMIIGMQ